ncbi:aldose epimerase family protein [Methylorubrum suomiense]|uniref:Aldose 1-epimerase n=1 Tax=Methylorubrum suomiense TaxID=144191 RepID=A0ABQ4UQK3_9HYPH|nr:MULTISPECIES: aldose epimerase family protein [Methylobacteriaceae]GJE74436.1 Aldose 1-epimerase [Methylorubrum suomiense]
MTSELFGRTAAGEPVTRHALTRGTMRVEIITYGAAITAVEVPARDGTRANVVLALGSVEAYETLSPHFGAVAGRYANRIAGGTFTIDGHRYTLPINAAPNTLHGGPNGFGKRNWRVVAEEPTRLALARRSPDGEEGFPGNLDVEVIYSLLDEGLLRLDYRAWSDRPTILNLTNHSYFNLAGEGAGDVFDHEVEIAADAFTPTNGTQVPTGEIRPVEGTPFDFRTPTPLGARIRTGDPQIVIAKGYDHNFVLRGPVDTLRPAARCTHPASGRRLDIATTQPGLQLYTGNNLDGTLVGPSGQTYRSGDGVCFETQGFPDAPNQPGFPSAILRPGQRFVSSTTYRFSVA